jgi:clan AA aspartic protease (TIGR02281 family)
MSAFAQGREMKHLPLRLCVAFLLSTSLCAWAGTIFKCRNSQGVMLYQEKRCEKEAEAVSSWAATSSMEVDSDSSKSDNQPLILAQGPGGHFYVDGTVNGSFLHFMIDTGATTVSVPMEFASGAKVKCKELQLWNTANGVAQGCKATIEKLKIGNFTLYNVETSVMPNLSQPLLGMNVLKQFRVEQDNGQMRLSRKY